MKRIHLGLLACALAIPSAAALYSQDVSGVVTYSGPDFRIRALQMNADPQCDKIHEGEKVPAQDRLVSKDKGVANTFVYLEEAPDGVTVTTPTEPVTLGQEGCLYAPRVLGIQVNQPLLVENDDPVLHNVRCMAKMNRPFNLGQPAGTKPREKVFRAPEKAVKFKCDVHPWMSAYIFVMEHPFYAVTDANGKFTIEGLPAGKHTLKAWHETFGELELEVDVPAAGTDSANFVFTE